jgi:hypothetical protein
MDGIFRFKLDQAASWSPFKANVRLYNLIGEVLIEKEFQMQTMGQNEVGFAWEWTEAERKVSKGTFFYEINISNDQSLKLGPFRGKIITLK